MSDLPEIPFERMTTAERLIWDAASVACGAALSVFHSEKSEGQSPAAVDALALELATEAIAGYVEEIAATAVGRLMLRTALARQGIFVARQVWGETEMGVPMVGTRQ